MGRLTRDPELRYTDSGKAVCTFSLAVDRDLKKEDGSRDCDFISCVCWGKNAEFVAKYFSKGRMAVADGHLQIREWTGQDGNKRRSTEVIVNSLYFADSKKDEHRGGAEIDDAYNDYECRQQFQEMGEDDEDLPF